MAKAPLKPFKIIGQLVGAREDEAGEIIAEEGMGEICIYRSQFGEVEKLIEDAIQRGREG
jgi:hypothetical protein